MVSAEAVDVERSDRYASRSENRIVRRAEAGLYDPALYFESKRRILGLLRLFADHDVLSLDEVAAALDRTSDLITATEAATLRTRIRELEDTIRAERLANDLAVWDLEEAGAELADERELVQESVVRIARLESQLKDARRTTLKLIAASRNGLATLKTVRDRLVAGTYAAGALAPLVHDFQELTQVVQELHALAVVRAAASPLQPDVR